MKPTGEPAGTVLLTFRSEARGDQIRVIVESSVFGQAPQARCVLAEPGQDVSAWISGSTVPVVDWRKILGIKQAPPGGKPEYGLPLMILLGAYRRASSEATALFPVSEINDIPDRKKTDVHYLVQRLRSDCENAPSRLIEVTPGQGGMKKRPAKVGFIKSVKPEFDQAEALAPNLPAKEFAIEWLRMALARATLRSTEQFTSTSDGVNSAITTDSVDDRSETNGRSPESSEGSRPFHRRPVLPVPDFYGRTTELEALRMLCAADSKVACAVVAGMPGVGKTSLVRQLVDEVGHEFDNVAWLNAADMQGGLRRTAETLGWKTTNDPTDTDTDTDTDTENVVDWLSQELCRRSVLLILDSAPERTSAALIPSFRGRSRLVITTRFSSLRFNLGRPATPIELDRWDRSSARAYLRLAIPTLSWSDAELDSISSYVDGLPMALRLLVRQISKPGMTSERLRRQLNEDTLATLDSVAQRIDDPSTPYLEDIDRPIAQTFALAIKHLTPVEHRIFVSCSVCAQGTTEPYISAAAGTTGEIFEFLSGLADEGLIEVDNAAAGSWTMHDLLRNFAERLPDAKESRRRHLALLQSRDFQWAITNFGPIPFNTSLAPKDIIQIVSPRSDNPQLSWVAAYDDYHELLAEAHSALKAQNGDLATGLLSASIPTAKWQGRHSEILDLALPIGSLPLSDISQVSRERLLAECYMELGQVRESIEHGERTVDLARKFGGKIETLSLQLLSSIYLRAGRFDDALRTSDGDAELAAKVKTSSHSTRPTADDVAKMRAVGLMSASAAVASRAFHSTYDGPLQRSMVDTMQPIFEAMRALDGSEDVQLVIAKLDDVINHHQQSGGPSVLVTHLLMLKSYILAMLGHSNDSVQTADLALQLREGMGHTVDRNFSLRQLAAALDRLNTYENDEDDEDIVSEALSLLPSFFPLRIQADEAKAFIDGLAEMDEADVNLGALLKLVGLPSAAPSDQQSRSTDGGSGTSPPASENRSLSTQDIADPSTLGVSS